MELFLNGNGYRKEKVKSELSLQCRKISTWYKIIIEGEKLYDWNL